MAFGNYIGTGTYTVVDEVIYGKFNKFVRCTLYVYSDNTKTNLLATKQLEFYFDRDYEEIHGINMTEPPANPVEGQKYHINPAGATGVFAGDPGKIAEWKSDINEGAGGYTFWFPTPGLSYWYGPEGQYYIITSDEGDIISKDFEDDWRMWDKWFAPEHVILNEENNLYKRLYEFLKTQPGFENVIDV